MGAQHMPGQEVWLTGEHRSKGERKYYLANPPADTTLKTFAASVKARRICEQAHQQLEGSWASTTSTDDPGSDCTGTR